MRSDFSNPEILFGNNHHGKARVSLFAEDSIALTLLAKSI
jgi:hypothetical protein